MISAIINTALSLALVGVIIYLLASYAETMIFVERLGYGVGAGMVILSLAKIWVGPAFMTPFNDWYQWGWRAAWLMAVGGKAYRVRRHNRNNMLQKHIAGAHFRSFHGGEASK
jgi:hypothetical protein